MNEGIGFVNEAIEHGGFVNVYRVLNEALNLWRQRSGLWKEVSNSASWHASNG